MGEEVEPGVAQQKPVEECDNFALIFILKDRVHIHAINTDIYL